MDVFLQKVNPDVVVDFGDNDAVSWPHVVASGADLFQFSIYFNEQPRGRRKNSEEEFLKKRPNMKAVVDESSILAVDH